MPALRYKFIPQYGVEPYLDNGGKGGANVTQENLVVSVWTVPNKGQSPPLPFLGFDILLKPNSVNTDVSVSAAERAGSIQAVPSRYSTYFYFAPDAPETERASDAEFPICLVVNPPAEYKQQMAGAVKYNGGDPLLITSYTVNKSLQGNYMWRTDFTPASAQSLVFTHTPVVLIGTYPPNTGASFGVVPLLKTSGADGNMPQFFDLSSAQGTNEMIETVNDGGEYFVPITFGVPSVVPGYCTLVWPHSAARG